jgi:hypothetical protein
VWSADSGLLPVRAVMWIENYWLVIIAAGVVAVLLGWIFQSLFGSKYEK